MEIFFNQNCDQNDCFDRNFATVVAVQLFNSLHILARFLFVWRFSETVNNVNNVKNGFLPMMHKLSVVTSAHV